jgi:hypothetical protein
MLRNILAVIVGIVVGSVVNMSLVQIGHMVITVPEGADISDMQTLAASMHLFEPKHFIFPFLAHAIGTLAGALIAALIAVSYQMKIALGIGVLFLIGGTAAVMMLPAPMWFSALDLIVAYIPMAWLGGKIGMTLKRS